MKTLCIVFISSLAVLSAEAQEKSGHVTVKVDPRLDTLIQRQIAYNTLALYHLQGFRVEVLITMSRSKAEEAKASMMTQFPQFRTYLLYQAPYYKVRVGDFSSREAAAPLQDAISKLYPEGVFTVPDLINATPLTQHGNNPQN
ncbi:MAG TPA: SPOR domain-containing protein [Chitinophagaceae bacterium]|nr:SPOR domain-containing protein [Chitinophagaceae bacterium]